jgi:predicted NAD/FAD-dependent oxidoreductase
LLPDADVVVVGAGISGISCARVLHDAGLGVVVLDRGRRLGGRMARWTRDGRAVDVGAAYLTVRDPGFREVAESWASRGLARPWTDTFAVADATGIAGTTTGPMRWAAEQGLRSLVEDLATGLDVRSGWDVEQVDPGASVDGRPARAVVLAMPDPQACDLLGDAVPSLSDGLEEEWRAVVTVVASYSARTWREVDAVFVHDAPVSLLVDDGRRRGDGAPVLVAHLTHEVSARYRDDPAGAVPLALEQVRRLLGVGAEPVWVEARRWGSAEPAVPHGRPYAFDARARIGVCGDAWSDRPRVEAAWLSGRDLGTALVDHLSS